MQAELQTIFQNFANFGAGKGPASSEIDGAKFAKLCKVCCKTDRLLKPRNGEQADINVHICVTQPSTHRAKDT